MSTFVSYVVANLSLKALPANTPSTVTERVQIASCQSKEALRTIFIKLDQSHSPHDIRECIDALHNLEYHQQLLSAELADSEELSLRRAILSRVALGLYGQALTTFLDEASEAEAERQWWSDVARSRRRTAMYLLQTLPLRVVSVFDVVLSTLRTRNIPIHPSVLKPSSLRRLFPSTNTLRPNTLTLALFPHLHHEPYSVSLTSSVYTRFSISLSPRQAATSALTAFTQTFDSVSCACSSLATLPVELAQGECSFKRKELTRIRDERAESLGLLVDLRDRVSSALETIDNEEALFKLAQIVHHLQTVVSAQEVAPFSGDVSPGHVLESLSVLANLNLPSHTSLHSAEIKTGELRRPSWLTLAWPRLFLLPPVILYGIRAAYVSRASLRQVVRDALETALGFWEDWVLEPVRGIVRTVRAGREDGVIVTKESVRADLESLERMTLALAEDKLHYSSPQLEALAQKVQAGDLTAVMQIYEEEIKSPLKSAMQGSLLRSLFIQVQKAKVDINQALSGIDKLLKSQELTFAFVGVAPALGIVFGFGSSLQRLWSGGRGRGRYGGKAKRASVWSAMRRIERLLISQPHPRHHRPHPVPSLEKSAARSTSVSPLTSGLLLLSVTHLRKYAETSLPTNSRLREGFLEDVADLEDPSLGRDDKLRVLDRMWRSWGEPLGWSRIAA